MATDMTAQEAFLSKMDKKANQPITQADEATKVYVRILFLRIGEIDTLNEKYQAQVSIEARWMIDSEKLPSTLSADDQQRLSEGKVIPLPKYEESNWHPQLYIENTLGDPKEKIQYVAKKSKHDNEIHICECREIKSLYWEKLELQHFPSDVQDLSISLVSKFYNDKVVLLADPHRMSAVNGDVFVDQQEWFLFKHVDVEQREIEDFHYAVDDRDDDDDDSNNRGRYSNSMVSPKYSAITVTCHVARRATYFYWNGYCFLMLLTLLSFCIYVTPPDVPASRLGSLFTLLLTITGFRWTFNRSIPPISYLTSFDKYSMLCVFFMVLQCFWVAIIGLAALSDKRRGGPYANDFVNLDHYVFFGMLSFFIILQLTMVLWLYFVPLKARRDMAKKDSEYRMSLSNSGTGQNMKTMNKNSKNNAGYMPISME